ncbi:MAG TPA: glycerophosphodiester phosphodiesterase [Gemmatimonadaceae bacterium]|nr:glycerophosphodiester phosphodiesterase [Gemmatimonadaceae bacterium]
MYSKSEAPIAISHRGLQQNAPENSIPAFLSAIDAGAAAVELDVHASLDGVIHVHHDPAPGGVDEDGNPWRPIAELDSKELSHAWLAEGVAIPTLDDVIEAIAGRAGIFIEIKGSSMEESVVRCLKRHLGRIDQLAIHSFDHRIVRRITGLLPSVRTGILQVSYLVDSCAALRMSGATDLWQHVDFIDAALVSGVHACRGRVIAWTPNTPIQWETLDALGVDGVCTDKVDEYVDWGKTRS